MAPDLSPDTGRRPDNTDHVERIVVQLPLRVTTVTRLLGVLAAEFPTGRWVDHPDGHLAIEVPKDEPDDEHLTMVRIDDLPGAGGPR
jgi:hypothetical protein